MAAVVLPLLRGRLVLLRQPVPADLSTHLAVGPNPEAHRMYGGSGEPPPLTTASVDAELASHRNQDSERERRFLIAALTWPDGSQVADADGLYIGVIRLHGIVAADRRARLAVGIFDRRFWSLGYGSEAIRLLLGYAFGTLSLHRVDLRVLAYNTRAIRAYEKCGFVREGVERESALVDGVWHDDVIMSILDREYRAGP